MGDASVQAYDRLVALFKHCAEEMKPFADIIDELGLEDKIAENGLVVNKESTMGDHAGGGVKRSVIWRRRKILVQILARGQCEDLSLAIQIGRQHTYHHHPSHERSRNK